MAELDDSLLTASLTPPCHPVSSLQLQQHPHMPRRDPRSGATVVGEASPALQLSLSLATQRALVDDHRDAAAANNVAMGSLAHRRQLQQTTEAMEQASFRLLNPRSDVPTTLAKAHTSPAATAAAGGSLSARSNHTPHATSSATLALVALAAAHSTASLASSTASGRAPPHLRAEPLSWSELQGRNLDSAATRRAAVSILGVANDHAEARRRPPPSIDFDAQGPGHGTTTSIMDRRAATRAHEEARRRILAPGVDFEAQEPGHAGSSSSSASSLRETSILQQMQTPRRRHDSNPLAAASPSSPSVPILSPSSVLLGVRVHDLRSPSSSEASLPPASVLRSGGVRRSHSHGEQSSSVVAPSRRTGSGVLLSPMRTPSFHSPSTERGGGGGGGGSRSRITEEEKGDEDAPAYVGGTSADAMDAAVAAAAPPPISVNQRVLEYFKTGAGSALWHSFATPMTREDAARLLAAVSGVAAPGAPSASAATNNSAGPHSPRSPVSPLSSSLKRSASLSVSPRSVVPGGALIPALDPTTALESLHACCASLVAQVPPRRFTGAQSLAPLLRDMHKERRAILHMLNSGRLLTSTQPSPSAIKQPWILRDVHRLIASTALVGSQGQCMSEPRLLRLLNEWSAAAYKYDSLAELEQVVLMVHREVPKPVAGATVEPAVAPAKAPQQIIASAIATARKQQRAQASATLSSPRKIVETPEKPAAAASTAAQSAALPSPPPAPTSPSHAATATVDPSSSVAPPSSSVSSAAAPVLSGPSLLDAVVATQPPQPQPPQPAESGSAETAPRAPPPAISSAPPVATSSSLSDSVSTATESSKPQPLAVNVLASPKQQQPQQPAPSPSRVVLDEAASALHAIRAASPRGEARSISPFSAARFDALPQRLYEGDDGVWRDARGQEEATYRAHMQTRQSPATVRTSSNPNRQPLLARRPTVPKQGDAVAV